MAVNARAEREEEAISPLHAASASSPAALLQSMLIGSSRRMAEVRHLIQQIAPTRVSVLITGPSGTGKEVVARCLHHISSRSSANFVAVNCGAIPRELLESELFGHEKGSFTGALQTRKGRFEAADGGTIFLDEIGDMPADMQVKLLRVLEERQIERVGSNKTFSVDVRVISATHKNLEEAIAENRFREDLFYRLNIFPVQLPALSERSEDIPELVSYFLRQMESDTRFSAEAFAALQTYDWPGNVRELRNVVERATILFPDGAVDAAGADLLISTGKGRKARNIEEKLALWEAASAMPEEQMLPPVTVTQPPFVPEIPQTAEAVTVSGNHPASTLQFDAPAIMNSGGCDIRTLVADLEQSLIRAALDASGEVIADAARLLGLQRTSLIEKMRKYQIERLRPA